MGDSLHMLNFLMGLVGALLTLYLAKQVVIPEARPLFDIVPIEKAAQQSRDQIVKTEKDLESVRALIIAEPVNSSYLTRDFEAFERALRDEQARLDRHQRLLLLNQIVSRATGFSFFVLLGGVFAAVFTGQVAITLTSSNGGKLPEPVQAIAIGASWTGLLSIFGIRGIQSVASSSFSQVLEQSTKRIDGLQQTILQTVHPGQPANASPAAPGSAEQMEAQIADAFAKAKQDLATHVGNARETVRRAV